MSEAHSRETAPPFLLIREAAAVLRVSETTVKEAIRRGDLIATGSGKTTRIPREALWPETPQRVESFAYRRLAQQARDLAPRVREQAAELQTMADRARQLAHLADNLELLAEEKAAMEGGQQGRKTA